MPGMNGGARDSGPGEWVLLSYRIPREPSTPRIAVWRKLKKLGVAQIGDGLVALPADARTREHLDWIADEVLEAGGSATVWLARPAAQAQERQLALSMARDRAAEYREVLDDAAAARAMGETERLRALTRATPPHRSTRLLPPAGASDGPGRGGGPTPRSHRPGENMKWSTRAGIHIDRAACAWLIRRHIDPGAEFVFVADPLEVPDQAIPFDMRGVELGHHGGDCSFETILRRYELTDEALWRIAQIVHEADLEDERYDAPEASGLDVVLRGLSMIGSDENTLAVSGPVFDGLYEYYRRQGLIGRDPA